MSGPFLALQVLSNEPECSRTERVGDALQLAQVAEKTDAYRQIKGLRDGNAGGWIVCDC